MTPANSSLYKLRGQRASILLKIISRKGSILRFESGVFLDQGTLERMAVLRASCVRHEINGERSREEENAYNKSLSSFLVKQNKMKE